MNLVVSPTDLAALTIWQEARGEPLAGKAAIAQVIKNRMKRNYHSDGTVAGTVLAPYQFSCWNTKNPNRIKALGRVKKNDLDYLSCVEVWETADEYKIELFPAVLFHTKRVSPSWAKHENVHKIATIGNHVFYNEVVS